MSTLETTTARCNLRPTVEITRGDFRCPRSTALLVAALLWAGGFATAIYLTLGLTAP